VDAFTLWLDDPELTVVDLAPRPETGAVTALGDANLAGVVGALALRGAQALHGRQAGVR
jgi:hypothetical protein